MAAVRITSAVTVGFTALLASYLYTQRDLLSTFVSNSPGNLQHVNALPNFEVRFADVVRNCEDAHMNFEAGWAILACDPGRDTWNAAMGNFIEPKAPIETGLYLYPYADGQTARPGKLKLLDFHPAAEDFHPLGVEYHSPSKSLFVVNHARSGLRIEVFKLFEAEHAASYVRTLRHPLVHAPNAVAAISDTELLVTNYHYFLMSDNPILATMESYSGLAGGSVVRLSIGSSDNVAFNATKLINVPFANGIVLLNDTHFAVASTTSPAVYIYNSPTQSLSGSDTVTLSSTIKVPFLPDNLSIDRDGTLLIAGHPYAPSLEDAVRNNGRCNSAESDKTGCPVRSPSWVAEWSENSGLMTLYVGDEYGTSCTAVRDVERGFGLVTGLYANGIGTWTVG